MLGGTRLSREFKTILARNLVAPLLMGAALCLAFLYLLNQVLQTNQELSGSDVVISKANESFRLIIDGETALRGFLITGEEPFLEPYNLAKGPAVQRLEELKPQVSGRSQMERLGKIETAFAAWQKNAEDTVELRRSGRYRSGLGAAERKVHMDVMRREFADLIQAAEQLRDERAKMSRERTRRTLALVVGICILAGALIAALGGRQLIRLSQVYDGALNRELAQNERLMQEAWLRDGQKELADQTRGEQTVEESAQVVLKAVAQRLDAQLGALYLLSEQGVLERAATFAYPADDQKAKLRFGEGLVGQAAADKKIRLLSEVPEDYVRVSSGLGETLPRNLVLAPLLAEGRTQGVLELAFMRPIEPRVTGFLGEIAEMTGMVLRSATYRRRLQDYLHESQQQNEELQAQQEELRAANEELAAQSRELEASQRRLESQHSELEQNNARLESQARLMEEQRHSLEEKARELEVASRYKSEFLANMSHELRTPLNSSLILAKLLMDNAEGNLNAEQVEFARTIYDAGNDLLTLINDILDLSKVESGTLAIEPQTVVISKLRESLEKTFAPVASDKGLGLRFVVDPETPDSILTDRQRLEQILRNLLGNALKFTHRGFVELHVSREPADGVRFDVRDTGIGIEPSQKNVIFEAFRQADGTTNRKYGGTGLGLSISKNLAQLLGGTIRVESEPGKGSVFTLLLPERIDASAQRVSRPSVLAPRPEPEKRPPAPAHRDRAPAPPPFEDDREKLRTPGGSTRRVLLVVEDEPVFARLLFDLAHEHGFSCVVAETAEDGFSLAKTFLPSAVILDVRLPGELGLSLLDRLKENSSTRHIPVHVVSVNDYAAQAKKLGAVGFQAKPTGREELRQTFLKLEEKIDQKIKSVLLVEDDAKQRKAIEKLIGGPDIRIAAVETAKDALSQIVQQTFDCVIVDLSLPDMSGFDLLEEMSKAADDVPPVIVYTGRSLSKEEEERLRRYSRAIIIKGARSPERLLEEVTLFLHQVEADLPADRQRLLKSSRNREKAFEGRKILIADDDVRNVFALTSMLEQKGAKVTVARNGREAVEKIDRDGDIDLVLMDIMMPEMDGYEAMRAIRQSPKNKDLPIIAVTAKAMKSDYERCLKEGANDYIAKPVDISKLVSLMRVWLPKEIGGA